MDVVVVNEGEAVYTFERAHRKLEAWKASIELAVEMHRLTERFPRQEQFELASQLRRAATSVPSNIAEGAGRNSKKELFHYLTIASGSMSEIDTQLYIAIRLGYINENDPIFSLFGGHPTSSPR